MEFLLSKKNLCFQTRLCTQLMDKAVPAQEQQTGPTALQHPKKIATSFSFVYVSSYRIKLLLPSLSVTYTGKIWLMKDLKQLLDGIWIRILSCGKL